ncbi:unnamed protein product, partial [Nesidiocoris tenuis]
MGDASSANAGGCCWLPHGQRAKKDVEAEADFPTFRRWSQRRWLQMQSSLEHQTASSTGPSFQ